MAMEHIGIKNMPVDIKPLPLLIPSVEEPKATAEPTPNTPPTVPPVAPSTTAEPTVDGVKKSRDAQKATAEPTPNTPPTVPPVAPSTTAEPTVDGVKKSNGLKWESPKQDPLVYPLKDKKTSLREEVF